MLVKGKQIDSDEIQVAIIAAKEAASNITYMGVNVGSRISDDEYRNIVTAIVTAIENYRSGRII
jgi:hypothetical protein